MFHYPVPDGPYDHTPRGYAVVDVETSGFDAGEARIVEIAIVRIDGRGRELGVYETLVDPGDGYTGASSVHGITPRMLARAPRFAEIAPSILAWLDGVVAVAHNAPFEDAFLSAEFARAGVAVPGVPALDTLPLAQSNLALANHKLSTVCRWAGVDIHGPHTAAGDARATGQLLPHLLRRADPLAWSTPLRPLGGRMTTAYLPRTRGKTSVVA